MTVSPGRPAPWGSESPALLVLLKGGACGLVLASWGNRPALRFHCLLGPGQMGKADLTPTAVPLPASQAWVPSPAQWPHPFSSMSCLASEPLRTAVLEVWGWGLAGPCLPLPLRLLQEQSTVDTGEAALCCWCICGLARTRLPHFNSPALPAAFSPLSKNQDMKHFYGTGVLCRLFPFL